MITAYSASLKRRMRVSRLIYVTRQKPCRKRVHQRS